jgi:hypothetical protein
MEHVVFFHPFFILCDYPFIYVANAGWARFIKVVLATKVSKVSCDYPFIY